MQLLKDILTTRNSDYDDTKVKGLGSWLFFMLLSVWWYCWQGNEWNPCLWGIGAGALIYGNAAATARKAHTEP